MNIKSSLELLLSFDKTMANENWSIFIVKDGIDIFTCYL